MVHQVLTYAAVEEMGNPASAVCAYPDEVGIEFLGKVQDPRFHGTVVEDVEGVIVKT